MVVDTAAALVDKVELFILELPATDERDTVEAEAVVAATPRTGNAWLLTLTYNACGRTELSDAVDNADDVETAALLVVIPLHCDDAVSLARVSRQGRFGSAL